jgi:hypothetical protein
MPIDRANAIRIAQEIVGGAALETVARRADNPEDLVAATALARDLIAAARRPHPIATAPATAERELLLYCPEQGGWYTGERLGGKWLLAMNAAQELKPAHWMVAPGPPQREKVPGDAGEHQKWHCASHKPS